MKIERMYLVTTGLLPLLLPLPLLLLGLVAAGCQERNPAYVQKGDGAVGPDTKPVAEDSAIPPDSRPAEADLPVGDGTGQGPDALVDGPAVVIEAGPPVEAGVSDVALSDARDAFRDARDLRKPEDDAGPDVPGDAMIFADVARDVPLLPDGGTDALLSLDVVGVPDVGVSVDAAPLCKDQDKRGCSSPSNPLIGTCQPGFQICTGGVWGVCTDEFLPASAELCNGVDDNCNGMTDEGCVADCVVVAPTGDDATADGTAAKPFATIEAAMALANAQDGGAPRRVCVAGGTTCEKSATYTMDAPLVMASGGRVQGNYALADSVLSYCASSQPPTTTLAFAASEQGVVFDNSVLLPTELSGFVIERYSPAGGPTVEGPVSAVLIKGAVDVTLSGIFVTDAPSADTTYGVDVESGGQTTIVGSAITGGQGRTVAVGVFVNGGAVNLRNNCDSAAKGFCNSSCSAGGSVLGIRGRTGAVGANGTADSSAVYVTKGSPTKTSIIANNLCGGSGNAGDSARGANLATLRCESGACATVAGNSISGGSGRQTMAISLLGGASLLDGNLIVGGCGTDLSTGVLLDDAPARLQNNRILGETCGGTTTPDFYGVHLLLGSSGGEPELHSNTIDPMGTSDDCQSFGVAIERPAGDGAAAGILRNNIISAGNCLKRFAVEETSNGAARIIENNNLYPGPVSASTDSAILYRRDTRDALTAAQVNTLEGAAKNISADPKFVSFPSDLHLSSGSPCIDIGTAEGAPAADSEGNLRPAGAGFDIGAFEGAAQ